MNKRARSVLWGVVAISVVGCDSRLGGPDVVDPDPVSAVGGVVAGSGTITLEGDGGPRGGYDFSTQTYQSLTGGDFYFVQAAFWANNVGQRGLVSAGACNSVDGVTNIPVTGWSQHNVRAILNNCYVSLTHNDERDHVVFRVDALSDTTVTLSWKLMTSGNFGATLLAGDNVRGGFDFASRRYFGLSGGDFYFVQAAFWANNTGQRGVLSLGPCAAVDSVTAVPTTGYSRFGVGATAGNCYAILTRNNSTVVARVDGLTATEMTLTWRLVTSPSGTLQITASSRTASTVSCTVLNNGVNNSTRSRLNVTFTASKFGLQSSRVVGGSALTRGRSRVVEGAFASGGTTGNPNIADLSGYEITCAASLSGSVAVTNPPPIITATGTVQALCDGANSLTADVDCWLGLHPGIAQYVTFEWIDRASNGTTPIGTHELSWLRWSNSQRADLRAVFAYYVDVVANQGRRGLIDPAPLPSNVTANLVTLTDADPAVTIVSDGDAWKTFIRYVAMSLAVEMNHAVPWSILNYDAKALASLFDSHHMFSPMIAGAGPNDPGGTFGPNAPGRFLRSLTLTNPVTGHLMVSNNYDPMEGFFAPYPSYAAPMWNARLAHDKAGAWVAGTKRDTIANALDWARRLRHFYNQFIPGAPLMNGLSAAVNWQVRGAAPVYLTLAGTVSSATRIPPDSNPYHYTAGCYGTSALLGSLLRTVNIPVEDAFDIFVGHSKTHFIDGDNPAADLYLSHADDPYISGDSNGLPTRGWAGDLLISASQYQSWFIDGGIPENLTHAKSIDRGAAEAMITGLTGFLLYSYCDDVRENVTNHAQSNILQRFRAWPSFYPVSYLENLPPVPGLPNSLWDRLAPKVAANGGCVAVQNALRAAVDADALVQPRSESLALGL